MEVNLPSELLLSDKPQIKLRAFGNALKSGDLVEFAIKAESLGWKKEKKVQGKAFKASFIKLLQEAAKKEGLTQSAFIFLTMKNKIKRGK